jgi:hypothetical protein
VSLVSSADAAIRGIADSVAFRAATAPYLLLDLDLRIRGANLAYQQVTHHDLSEMAGEDMFRVFPDNPATPEAHSVERLSESFERALSAGGADRMGIQRYDVLDEHGGFVLKSWLPTNSPVRDPEGRTVGILHHVEDVTRLLLATELERDLLAPQSGAGPRPDVGTHTWTEALRRDSLERRTRAQMLIRGSRQTIKRLSTPEPDSRQDNTVTE